MISVRSASSRRPLILTAVAFVAAACLIAILFAANRPPRVVYVLGDSWSTGYSAAPGRGYTELLSEAERWVLTINAQSGTGYTANLAGNGAVFSERVRELPTDPPQLVIVQGGLNDEWASWGTVQSAAAETIDLLRTRYSDTPIVLIGPATARWPVSDTLWNIDEQLREAATAIGALYVSPLEGEWVTSDNIATFIDPATKHPSTKGHAIFAERLIEALRENPSYRP